MILMIYMLIMMIFMSLWMNVYMYINIILISMLMLVFMMMKIQIFNLNMEFLYLDLLSLMLLFLTLWIIILMFIYENSFFKKKKNNFKMFIMFLMLFMLLVFFSVKNMFYLYLFYESSLIPIMLMVFMYSNQMERIKASFYLIFYTLFMSLPFLMIIIFLMKINFSLNFMFLFLKNLKFKSILLSMFCLLIFLVKMPMYMMHMWLPKAHVEAPLTGSMILAGVLLKMGGFGLIKLMFFMINKNLMYLLNIIFSLSLLGGLKLSIFCLYQTDIKSLIAYSSVCHMALIICGLLSFNNYGICGSLLLMLSHGLVSSNLFFMSNMLYERYMSRNLYLLSGLINLMKSLIFYWFLFVALNMGVPPSMSFMGEMILILSIMKYNNYVLFVIILLSLMTAAYSIFFFVKLFHSKNVYLMINYNMTKLEMFIIMMHFIPLVLFLFNFNFFFY